MTKQSPPNIKESLALFGQIGASLSHDINNVFAIIGELNGLINDMVTMTEGNINTASLSKVAARIEKQLDRGARLTKSLNTFAHSIDHDDESMDLEAVVSHVVALCERSARMRKATLSVTVEEMIPLIKGNRFQLQHLIFLCIEQLLAASPLGIAIHIHAAPHPKGVEMTFRADPDATLATQDNDTANLSVLENLSRQLNAGLVQKPDRRHISLTIPGELTAERDDRP